jgi:hypothetical protein
MPRDFRSLEVGLSLKLLGEVPRIGLKNAPP